MLDVGGPQLRRLHLTDSAPAEIITHHPPQVGIHFLKTLWPGIILDDSDPPNPSLVGHPAVFFDLEPRSTLRLSESTLQLNLLIPDGIGGVVSMLLMRLMWHIFRKMLRN